jgi:hypothetical protein
MVDVSTIERLPDESARAFRARVEYVTMGPDRSLEKTRQRLGKSAAGYKRVLEEWSTRYDWQATAQGWDNQQAAAQSQEAADRYRADLEAHRKRASDAAQGLYTVAAQLIKAMNQALANPRKIEGKDGKMYTLHGIDLNASAYSAAVRGMQTALDIEGHALGLSELMPKLANDDSE